ncbi:uncharacterized protein LOC111409423 [Olea europaea var. sylvestris]|uniref:uncharacterized protein LOC111409423 n=1 Tax=Olea europaea var. sylvestris TaxID=158386 RepID=UPI000C1CD9D1|nr:uncharacterized protein LOC111409423 [Olea europaea var. sylvestris]
MKGREGKGPPSADLLVCFPSRAHLTLMPKPICSLARPNSEHNKRHHHCPRLHQHLRKSSNRGVGAVHASPHTWAKNKATSSEIEEPTSPEVTCAGQIKVRPKPNTCKNWQSVTEEIERLHISKKHKKRPAWIEALGFKKDIMQFLTCLRSIRFDFHCLGTFPTADITSEDDDDEEGDDDQRKNDEDCETSRTIFSKWFMVLQENQSKQFTEKDSKEKMNKSSTDDDVPCAPPPNALLLMRCRSAPAKSWEDEEEDEEKLTKVKEENTKRKENLVLMQYGADFYKISSDIAKETWVVGGIKDSLSRSPRWKR